MKYVITALLLLTYVTSANAQQFDFTRTDEYGNSSWNQIYLRPQSSWDMGYGYRQPQSSYDYGYRPQY